MTRQQILTGTQLAALFDPPTDQRELVRHYTLSATDLAMIQRCRGDQNRLGYPSITDAHGLFSKVSWKLPF
ncbi:MAG: DUF4158 domain-containing protein [Methylocella sp.]